MQCPRVSLSVIWRRRGFSPSQLPSSLPCSASAQAGTAQLPAHGALSEQRTGKLLPAPLVQGSAGGGQSQETGQLSQAPTATFCLGHYHHIELYSQGPVLEMYFGRLLVWLASIKSRECSCVSSLTRDRAHLSQTCRIRHGRDIS